MAAKLDPLTGLRIFAAGTVIYHHIKNHWRVPVIPGIDVAWAFSSFFVLSGFILTFIYDGALNTRADQKRYFVDRFARIYPVHFVTLLVVALLAVGYFKANCGSFVANLLLL